MLKQTSNDFKEFFLLAFTRELINNSGQDIYKLKEIVEEETENLKQESIPNVSDVKEIVKEKIEEEEKTIKQEKKLTKEIPLVVPSMPPMPGPSPIARQRIISRTLNIPEPMLPLRLQYLKPIPRNREIDLGKLNPLINDPMIRILECYGPDEYIQVRGTMGSKPTNITLNKKEIKEVINNFSEASKIPAEEGVYRVVVGRLILLAVISEMVTSKFVIKKMTYSVMPPAPSF